MHKPSGAFSQSPVKPANQSFQSDLRMDTDDEDDCSEWRSRPEVWSDDTRMNALFAPFRNRDLNPLHYDAKLQFWKETITSLCKEKETLQVDLSSLEKAFTRKGKKPKCLEIVLNQMVTEGVFQARDDVLKPKTNGILYSMFNKLVWTPLSWSTGFIMRKAFQTPTTPSNKLPSVSSSPAVSSRPPVIDLNSSFTSPRAASFSSPSKIPSDRNDRRLVFIGLIEEKAYDLFKRLQDLVVYKNTDCVIGLEPFCELAKKVLTKQETFEEDLDLLVKYLQVQSKLIVDDTSVENKRLIKFSHNWNSNVEPLSQIEQSYQELRRVEEKLELEMNNLNTQIENLKAQARECIKQNNKNTALKHLRKRKLLEKSYETKEGALSNIQGVMISIQQADSNKMTFDVYNKSIQALKEVNKGVNIDQVEDTMGDLKDILDATSEVQEALARPVESTSSKYSAEDDDLLKELNDLLKEEPVAETSAAASRFDMSQLLESLPAVPSDNPTTQLKFLKKSGVLEFN